MELSWVTILQGEPTQIQLDPSEDIAAGDYTLILQSFDDNGSKKTTLKEEIITIGVVLPEATVLPQSNSFKRDTPAPGLVSIQQMLSKTISIENIHPEHSLESFEIRIRQKSG